LRLSRKLLEEYQHNPEKDWQRVLWYFIELTGKKPDLNTILFMIGVREMGFGKQVFSKEEKQDLMHIATCRLLSQSGFYELEYHDEQGWPHFRKIREIPGYSLKEQEELLKLHIIEYFLPFLEDENHNV
jgi:hypothetical protein